MGEAYLDWQSKSGGIKLNDVIEEFKYVYKGQEVKAGDFVNYINGVAGKTDYGESVDTQLSTETNSGLKISAVQLDENRVFIAHSYSSNYHLYGVVCTINGGTINYGTDTRLSSNQYTGYVISACLLPDGRVFIAHSYTSNYYLNYMLCTIEGNAITVDNEVQKYTTNKSGYRISTCVLPNGNVFVAFCWSDNQRLYAETVTISGTTITGNGNTSVSTTNNSGLAISTCLLPNGNVFVAHNSDGSNYYLKGQVCKISGTTITAGDTNDTTLVSEKYAGYIISAVTLEDSKVFIAHSQNSNSSSFLYGIVCTISGTTITAGTNTELCREIYSGATITTIALGENKVCIVHRYGASYYLYGVICTINGTTIATGAETALISTSYTGNEISSLLLNNETIFVAHSMGSSGYLYAQIFGIDYENNIPTNNIVITEYEQQVTPAIEPPFNAIALSSGVGAPEFVEVEVEVTKTGNIFPTSWAKETATKYTASDGTILSASTVTNNESYPLSNCCDGNTSTHTNSGELSYSVSGSDKKYSWKLIIEFTELKKISKMNTTWSVTNGSNFNRFYVKGSNDGSTWKNLYTTTVTSSDSKEHDLSTSSNFDSYKYYQLYWEWSTSGGMVTLYEWQTSEYVEKEIQQVPSTEHNEQVKIARVYKEITKEVAKAGDIFNKTWNEIVAYEQYQADDGTKLIADCISTNPAYIVTNAFDSDTSTRCAASENGASMKLEFIKPIKITKMKTWIDQNQSASFTVIIQGSNNDSEWTNLYTINSAQSKLTTIELNNTDFFKFYQMYIICSSASSSSFVRVYEWQTSEYIEKVTEVIQ